MNRRIVTMQGSLKLLIFALCATLTLAIEESEIQVSNGNKALAKNLYELLAKNEGDTFFSPLGIHTVLSMIYQGADGTSKEALASALQVPEPSIAAEGYSQIITSINHIENVTLYMANKAWVKEGFQLVPEFDRVVKDKFQTQVDALNFEKKDTAVSTINSWVSDQTKGKITELFNREDFDPYTRFVLVNAIYFKGSWSLKFDKEATRTEPFFLDDNNKIDVQMMHKSGGFNFKHDSYLNAKVVELPFRSSSVSMFIVHPVNINGMAELERKIQAHGLDPIFEGMHWNTHVIVALPKFKLEKTINLESPLTEIGLGVIFDDQKSNLSKIIENEKNVYISKAVQKIYVEVNEEGAEAAGVTEAHIVSKKQITTYEEIYVNHPFLVAIKQGDSVLFYGKIMKPVSGDLTVAPRSAPKYYHSSFVVAPQECENEYTDDESCEDYDS